MRFLIMTICLLCGFSTIVWSNERPYWTVDEFTQRYPQKQKDSRKFEARVRRSGSLSRLSRPLNIVVVYPGLQASDYWRRSVSSLEARLREMQQAYVITNHFTTPGNAVREQSKQISAALESNPDYLIFTLDANKHQSIIEKLIAKKRPKVILQNITTPLKTWSDRQPLLYVGFDHAIGTQILAQQYLKRFNNSARYAIFYGPQGYVSEMRGGTFKNAMQAHAGMALVAEYYTGFDREKSKRAAMQVLSENADLDFIYACSTDIALGVIDALKETGRTRDVITNGWGGGSAELNAIAAKDLEMTVMRMNDDNGVAMAEAMIDHAEGHSVPTIYSGDMELVDQSFSNQDIAALKKRAFRYSDTWHSDLSKTLTSYEPNNDE